MNISITYYRKISNETTHKPEIIDATPQTLSRINLPRNEYMTLRLNNEVLEVRSTYFLGVHLSVPEGVKRGFFTVTKNLIADVRNPILIEIHGPVSSWIFITINWESKRQEIIRLAKSFEK